MQDTNGEVRHQIRIAVSFSISNFCVYSVLRHITWKLQVICGSLAYWTTAMLSETLFVWLRVALEIQLESYGPRHTSVILWYMTLYAYTQSINKDIIKPNASKTQDTEDTRSVLRGICTCRDKLKLPEEVPYRPYFWRGLNFANGKKSQLREFIFRELPVECKWSREENEYSRI